MSFKLPAEDTLFNQVSLIRFVSWPLNHFYPIKLTEQRNEMKYYIFLFHSHSMHV